ncbi:MAG: TonB-dependent receptor domain-containing protein, partial [Pseudobacter sp.]|uniref:TonB-dependent receptor domain-containing protein n=1 Tax=Pseudobacter sp. TaxID=2045420 RepID=UPI003F7CFCA4
VYGYTNGVTGFGTGVYLNQLGSPDLDWQTTKQISTGLDLAFRNNKLLITFNAFQKQTDPLVVVAPAPASIGVSNYAINAGQLTIKGLEAIIKYSPLMNPAKGIQWTLGVTGSIAKSRYANFNSILEKENEKGRTLTAETPVKDIPAYLRRYLDGYSPDDIWAVRSLGIDPASGKEIMIKKDGTHTLYYDVADETVIGSAQPKVQGVISSNLNIKNFSVSIYLRYSLKQAIFNTAMFNKVENITLDQLSFNQDKRALYERWKKPGDVAMFRSIYLSSMDGQYSLESPPTSRFIQEENYLSGESISIGYEMSESTLPWLHKLRIRTLRINAISNELFRLSNITAERGTDYPFAKTYSLSLNVFF